MFGPQNSAGLNDISGFSRNFSIDDRKNTWCSFRSEAVIGPALSHMGSHFNSQRTAQLIVVKCSMKLQSIEDRLKCTVVERKVNLLSARVRYFKFCIYWHK